MTPRWDVVVAPVGPILPIDAIRDDHVRAANGSTEDAYLESLVLAADSLAQEELRRSLRVQTLRRQLSGFYEDGRADFGIVLPRPPIIEIESVTYVDGDGETQTIDAANYVLVETGRTQNREGLLLPAYGVTWPTTRTQPQAVTVTYRAGYVGLGSPEVADVPEGIIQGIRLMVGELYKQRSLSVHAMNQNASIVGIDGKAAFNLWARYKVY